MAEPQKQEETQKQEKKPDLGLLEEDDEFEEFPADAFLGHHPIATNSNACQRNIKMLTFAIVRF
ncbi:hypothetical protein ACJMK2_022342 [Sinanodonta woodiana]|uniref:Uncharacterized protein n=1 Tax=Sinanodonta woodiana TaxID=1069815 RepID=A0ABD3TJI9_SINWO